MTAATAAPPSDSRCRDCGAPAPGRHCPACGQKTVLPRTLGSMVSSLVHDFTHIDGKLWRTLPLLVLRPGVLTRQYIDGRRTRYVGPNVIFLGSAFFMFLSFNLLPGPAAAPVCYPASTTAVRHTNAAMRDDLEALAPGIGDLLPAPAESAPPAAAWLEKHAPPKLLAQLETALSNPPLALTSIKQKAYKLGFLLVPLALPALWLLVGRRPQVRPYDLTVFSLYSIGFMSVLLTAIMLLAGLSLAAWPLYAAILIIVPPLHFFVHLRDTFALAAGETLWRTAALCVVAVISLIAFLMLISIWGILA